MNNHWLNVIYQDGIIDANELVKTMIMFMCFGKNAHKRKVWTTTFVGHKEKESWVINMLFNRAILVSF